MSEFVDYPPWLRHSRPAFLLSYLLLVQYIILAWLPSFLPFILQHVSMISQINLKLIETLDLWEKGGRSGDSGDKCSGYWCLLRNHSTPLFLAFILAS